MAGLSFRKCFRSRQCVPVRETVRYDVPTLFLITLMVYGNGYYSINSNLKEDQFLLSYHCFLSIPIDGVNQMNIRE